MPCTPFVSPDGRVVGFVCGPRRGRGKAAPPCSMCGRPAGLLCDGVKVPIVRAGDEIQPLPEEATACDAPICGLCATTIGRDRHLCPTCAGAVPAHAPRPIPR